MTNPIKEIYRFNKEAGLLDKGYDDKRECAYPIEEMLEGFELGWSLDIPPSSSMSAKDLSRIIVDNYAPQTPLADVDRFDKHLDAIVFNFGSLFKLGLTPQQAMKGLSVVMQANMQKLHAGQDSEGKQLKPKDFVGPEEQLQKILDERNKNE
ncbi:MAG: hypothetical protein PVF17_01405 [Ignavibacteria bacterium]|jgi:hypothetical protein